MKAATVSFRSLLMRSLVMFSACHHCFDFCQCFDTVSCIVKRWVVVIIIFMQVECCAVICIM